ncbi:hypothetical protein CHS0354_020704, partial [Potamilus streckersoni]
MEEYEKSTGKKAKYPRSNRELEELQNEIHTRRLEQPLIDVDIRRPVKQTRHQKVLKLIKDYEATFGRKPKYPMSNVELEQLQYDLEMDKKSTPPKKLIKKLIDYILIKQTRSKIIVELCVTIFHAFE